MAGLRAPHAVQAPPLPPCCWAPAALVPLRLPFRHLASSEGAYQVTEWLLTQSVDVNALDRFKRTPLEVRRDIGSLYREGGGADMRSQRVAVGAEQEWQRRALPCLPEDRIKRALLDCLRS